MYIQSRPTAAIYRLIVGSLALIWLWIELATFGSASWRLFSNYVLLGATLYFLVSALVTVLARKREPGKVISPTLQGMLILAGMTLFVGQLIFYAYDIKLVGPTGWNATVIDFLLPILMLGDWIFFSEKGRFRPLDPWYWLALPVSYGAMIVFTSAVTPQTIMWRFPYEPLDYLTLGIDRMIWWALIIAVLILAFGYFLQLLDFAVSGKLAQHVVMPRIKTIVIEPEPSPDDLEDEATEEVVVAEMIPPLKKQPAVDVVKPGSSTPKTSKSKTGPKSKPESKSAPKPATKLKEEAKPESSPSEDKADAQTKQSEPKPKVKVEVKPEPTSDHEGQKPDSKPESKPEIEGLKDAKSAQKMHGSKSASKKSQPKA